MARARYSSWFSIIVSLALLAFVWGVTQTVPKFRHWSFILILILAGILAASLIAWAIREWSPRRTDLNLIGFETLGMVGGVAVAVIAAVTLSLALNSALDQQESLRIQTGLLERQAIALERIDTELQLLRRSAPTNAPATPAPNPPPPT